MTIIISRDLNDMDTSVQEDMTKQCESHKKINDVIHDESFEQKRIKIKIFTLKKIKYISYDRARTSTVAGSSLYSKLGWISALEFERDTIVSRDLNDTLKSKDSLHDEIFFDTLRVGSKRRRRDKLSTNYALRHN